MVKSVTFSVFLLLFGTCFLGCGDKSRSNYFPPGFQVTTTSLPNTSVGSVVSETITTQNGQAPYTWAVVSGALPPGLSLGMADGVVGGTPTTAGTYNFRTRVTDGTGAQAERDLTLLVGSEPVEWNPGNPFNPGMVGQQFATNLNQAVTGGVSPITFQIVSGSLPPGLTLDESTGFVGGTPTTAGTFSVNIRAISSPDPVTSAASQAELGTSITIN